MAATESVQWTSREAIVRRLAEGLMADYGDKWHRMTIRDIADAAVDVLTADATLMPSERWDEDCHVCCEPVGDHLVDGRHPRELVTTTLSRYLEAHADG